MHHVVEPQVFDGGIVEFWQRPEEENRHEEAWHDHWMLKDGVRLAQL